MPNSLGLVSNRPPTKLCSVAINRPTTKLCSVAINRPPTKQCSVAILFRLGWSFRGSGLEFVYLGRFYLQYSLGSGVCSPGHVLFTIQSWVWSLFTWARLIYNTVLGLEFVYLGMSYLQYSLGFGVCLPGHLLFTIQSSVWSLFTWACLIYNTVLERNTRKNQGMYKLRHKYCHSFGFL